jgi:hypothetical protein
MSDEILTMSKVAAVLKMTERQVYELARRRSLERMEYPFSGVDYSCQGDLMGILPS